MLLEMYKDDPALSVYNTWDFPEGDHNPRT